MSETPCSICRGVFSAAEIFMLEGKAVCVRCKPAVLARVLSGAPEPLEPVDLLGPEMGFGAVLSTAWMVFQGEWPRVLPLAAGISLLSSGVLALLPEYDRETAMGVMRDVRNSSVVELVVGVISTIGVAWLVRERLEGRRGSFGGALAHAGRRWLAAVGTGWLEGIILVFFFLLLVVPGILYAGYYTFSTIIVALSARGGLDALRHSKALVTGRWWRVFGYSTGLLVPFGLLSVGSGFVAGLWPGFTCPKWAEALLLDLSILPATLGLTALYLHLDTRQRARTAAVQTGLSDPQFGQDFSA